VLWFGVDDSSTTAHFPIYGGATEVPMAYAGKGTQDGVTPPMMTFSPHSAFYAFNVVSNFVYPRWQLVYPDLEAEILAQESAMFATLAEVDATALKMVDAARGDTASAVQYATSACVKMGNDLVAQWVSLFGRLFVKFRDGYGTSSLLSACLLSLTSS
jgi:hypothetical protein